MPNEKDRGFLDQFTMYSIRATPSASEMLHMRP